MIKPRHKSEFAAIYNLDDPGPYYVALEPADYRMPGVLTQFLASLRDGLAASGSNKSIERVLDFACGYGANGALLRHHLTVAELYQHYSSREWQPGQGRANWLRDKAFFDERRRADRAFEIAGLDIAPNAVDYAQTVGLMDRGFTENILTSAPSHGLRSCFANVDLVIESGALGAGLRTAFSCVLEQARPWFAYCPRPDVDWNPLQELWQQTDYVATPCCARPVQYRRALSPDEAQEMLRDGLSRGLAMDEIMRDGYLVVDLMLARPAEECEPDRHALQELFSLLND